MEHQPARQDWTPGEVNEYFTFKTGLTTSDRNAIYYGELITLYNPNIKRATIEAIPERTDEKPKVSDAELEALRSMLSPDLTLMANPYQIKKIKPPDEEEKPK